MLLILLLLLMLLLIGESLLLLMMLLHLLLMLLMLLLPAAVHQLIGIALPGGHAALIRHGRGQKLAQADEASGGRRVRGFG